MRHRNAYPGKLHRPLMYRWAMDWQYTPPTEQELESFKRFLDRLVQVEKVLVAERARQSAWLDDRLERGEIDDYETETELTFYLRDDDPAIIEDDDNIFFQLTYYADATLMDSELNWDCELYESYPLLGYPHPYLFHELRVHSGIPFRDMLRIGMIWVDVDFTVQRFLEDPSAGSAKSDGRGYPPSDP